MAQQDLISVTIPEADQKEIQDAITVLKTKLLPHLKNLTAQDRLELPKMGDKSVAVGQKALEYGQKNPALIPPYVDLPAMAGDMEATLLLRSYNQDLGPFVVALDDSVMLAGSDVYQGALSLYNSFQYAAKMKVPNAGAIYDDLSARFPGRGPAAKKA